LVTGVEHPTVITFDMALYEKAVQLVDAREDLKGTVLPRLDELHTVMAALRALGKSIENLGIDDAWIEADVCGSATTRQILKCAHYKGSLHAHVLMYMALYELLLDMFFKEKPHIKSICSKPVNDEVGELKVKRRALQTDAEALSASADDFADHAEKFQQLTLLAKANGMRRAAREKAAQLKELNQLIYCCTGLLCVFYFLTVMYESRK